MDLLEEHAVPRSHLGPRSIHEIPKILFAIGSQTLQNLGIRRKLAHVWGPRAGSAVSGQKPDYFVAFGKLHFFPTSNAFTNSYGILSHELDGVPGIYLACTYVAAAYLFSLQPGVDL